MNYTETAAPEPILEQDLFSDEESFHYQDASTGQRFFNFLIDAIFMRFVLNMLVGTLVVETFLAVSPETAYSLFGSESFWTRFFVGYLIGAFNCVIYYTFCEKAFKGYTLGKLITGTRAVSSDGRDLTLKQAFQRSASRLVPFETFSAFGGYPWHDQWTNTMVIKTR